jgi:ElaB/YqjD/DUF883 family membrane-anchored ribosome-binding protein
MAREWHTDDMTSQNPGAIEVSSTTEELLQNTDMHATRLADATGAKLKSAAQTLRQSAPDEGIWGKTALAVADQVEGAGTYLQEVNLVAIGEDLASLMRRYPVHTLLIGASIGFLLGRRGR